MDPSRLKSISLFQKVPDEDLREIAPFAQEVSVEEGSHLVREGDFSYEFMAIEEGEAEVTRDGEHVNDLGPGDFFGELALLGEVPRTATATCTTPCRLLVVGHREFHSLLSKFPTIQTAVLESLARRIARLEADNPH